MLFGDNCVFMLVCWYAGMLVCLVCWYAGILGMLKYWYSGMLVCLVWFVWFVCSGLVVCWYTGMLGILVCWYAWYAGMLVCWYVEGQKAFAPWWHHHTRTQGKINVQMPIYIGVWWGVSWIIEVPSFESRWGEKVFSLSCLYLTSSLYEASFRWIRLGLWVEDTYYFKICILSFFFVQVSLHFSTFFWETWVTGLDSKSKDTVASAYLSKGERGRRRVRREL